MRPVKNYGGMMNPLEQWSDTSDYGYAHIHGGGHGDHLYHTLDPVHAQAGVGGMLEVMLPGGQVVHATLVRNNTGKIIPMVKETVTTLTNSHL